MGGETSGQTQARRYTKKAVGTLQGAQGALLLDPNFLLGRDLAYELAQSPYSMPPEVVQGIINTGTENAYGAYRGQLDQLGERATAAQGYRSGATRMQERRAAQGLGSDIANLTRQTMTTAALQRPQDIIQAINAQLPILQTQFQFPRDIANVYSGAATNPILAQPSPLAQVGGGLGGLLGIGLAPGGFLGLGGGGGKT